METLVVYPARAIRLPDGISIAAGQDGQTAIALGDASMRLPALPPHIRAVLDSLSGRDLP